MRRRLGTRRVVWFGAGLAAGLALAKPPPLGIPTLSDLTQALDFALT